MSAEELHPLERDFEIVRPLNRGENGYEKSSIESCLIFFLLYKRKLWCRRDGEK